MATLDVKDRVRIILDLVKDGTVPSTSSYDNVQKVPPARGNKYGQAFWDLETHVDSNDDEISNPTNDQLAANCLNKLRAYIRDILKSARIPKAAKIARSNETTAVASETQTDLGSDEAIPE